MTKQEFLARNTDGWDARFVQVVSDAWDMALSQCPDRVIEMETTWRVGDVSYTEKTVEASREMTEVDSND